MWTRELLKSNAKLVLQSSFWPMVLIYLVYYLLSGSITAELRVNTETLQQMVSPTLAAFFLGGTLLAVLYSIFVASPLVVGIERAFMENRNGGTRMGTLFSVFREGQYLNVVAGLFLTDLKIFLWSLLLVVPGIIKAYEYFLVPYLLAENPHMESKRAQQLSRNIMDGEKGNVFVLGLSFLGWALLGALCASLVGVISTALSVLVAAFCSLLLSVYQQATFAELYAALREKAFALGLTGQNELSGFAVFPRP